jgi:heat shock protein HslJ
MNKFLTILSILILIFIACNQDKNKSKPITEIENAGSELAKLNFKSLSGNWTLICLSDIEKRISEFDIASMIHLKFKDDKKTGSINGHSKCNTLFGEYKLFDSNKIKVEGFGGTKLNCHDKWEHELRLTMYQSSSYTQIADTLIIFYDNDRKAMKFLKNKDAETHNIYLLARKIKLRVGHISPF